MRLSIFAATMCLALDGVSLRANAQTAPDAFPALISQLGSDDFQLRQQAEDTLTKIGIPALLQLEKALTHENPEIAARAQAAITKIDQQLEQQREACRKAIASANNDPVQLERQYVLLLTLRPSVLDCRDAAAFFNTRQDWPHFVTALEIGAEHQWRIIHMPPEAFIRSMRQAPLDPPEGVGVNAFKKNPGGPYEVQADLDGNWATVLGDPTQWKDTIQRKQQNMTLERLVLLHQLGKLSLEKLHDPQRAVAAYQSAGREIPICTEPLEKLIPQLWPKATRNWDEVLATTQAGADHIRLPTLEGLADSHLAAGNLKAAAEARTRAMLTQLFTSNGDWNAHGPAQQAEAFFQILQKFPANQPLPPTLWLHVLDADYPNQEFPAPESGPHKLPFSFPGPRLIIRPGQHATSLTIAAEMENVKGGGNIRVFSMSTGKPIDFGNLQWHADGRKGREWREATLSLPENPGIIRLEITPYSGADFHVHNLKVSATFTPAK